MFQADEKINNVRLNIYSGSPGSSLDVVLKNCQTLKLDFLPYQLHHALHACGTNKEVNTKFSICILIVNKCSCDVWCSKKRKFCTAPCITSFRYCKVVRKIKKLKTYNKTKSIYARWYFRDNRFQKIHWTQLLIVDKQTCECDTRSGNSHHHPNQLHCNILNIVVTVWL